MKNVFKLTVYFRILEEVLPKILRTIEAYFTIKKIVNSKINLVVGSAVLEGDVVRHHCEEYLQCMR